MGKATSTGKGSNSVLISGLSNEKKYDGNFYHNFKGKTFADATSR